MYTNVDEEEMMMIMEEDTIMKHKRDDKVKHDLYLLRLEYASLSFRCCFR
jgi:hypothetical protein